MSGRPPTTLSDAERAFCNHYLANGGDAKAAAIKAGYSANGAANAGYRLTKRETVQKELARLKGATGKVVDRLLIKAVDSGMVPEALIKRDGGMVVALSRAYAQYGLTQALGMALGQVPQIRSRVIKPRPTKADPRPPVIVDEYLEKVADAKGAAYCATLLGKEIDRIEGVPPQGIGTTIDGELVESPLRKQLAAYYDKVGLPHPPERAPQPAKGKDDPQP